MSYVRTTKHRALRSALIRHWKPWEKSTGPKSPEGKERAAMRGLKGRIRPLIRELARAVAQQKMTLDKLPP